MPRTLGSVRARTALGATLVVAVALVTAGLLVLNAVRSGLGDTATSRAEAKAREVATQVAVEDRPRDSDGLDTEDPVQIVGTNGRVLARSPGASDLTNPISTTNQPEPGPSRQHDPRKNPESDDNQPGDRDDDDDDDDTDDDADNQDSQPTRPSPEQRGQVSSAVGHDTAALNVDQQGRPVGSSNAGDPGANSPAKATDFSIASVRASTPEGAPVTVYAGASLAAQQRAVDEAGRAMLAGLPFVLAVVALVAWLVVSRALRPVEDIRTELATITASDDLGRRVPEPASRDEISALARTTNQTLTALQHSAERQRQFVADASHELRSPIASLRTQLEVAAAHPELLDIDGVVDDVVRLQELATDLLLLARLDAGELPRREAVSLADLVQAELARDNHPVRVQERVISDSTVQANRTQIARVLTNVVNNAVRHARSEVIVTVTSNTIAVDDDGPGIPPDQTERIFERFVRLDDARTRDEGGAGLGLTIARDVMRRHGGDLVVQSAPTGGARFESRFPDPSAADHAGPRASP